MTNDVQSAVVARILLQDFLACTQSLHTDAANKFLQLALVYLATQIEQTGHQSASRADRDVTGNKVLRRTVLRKDGFDGLARQEQQLGLGRCAHRGFVPVVAQHGDLGKDLALLAHAHADFLAMFNGKYANRAGLDHQQAIGWIARIAHGVAEGKEPGFCVLSQPLEFIAGKWREDFYRRQKIGNGGFRL